MLKSIASHYKTELKTLTFKFELFELSTFSANFEHFYSSGSLIGNCYYIEYKWDKELILVNKMYEIGNLKSIILVSYWTTHTW